MQRVVLVALVAAVAQGCVGIGTYKELEGRHSHLLDVKEQWESEQSDLSRRVEDTGLAYQRLIVDQGAFKQQMESVLQNMRAVKSDLQLLSPKVEGQGTTIKEQLQQYTALRDQFSQVISQVATLAETNLMLANRVEQLTKLTKLTAMKVAEANKKSVSVAMKPPSATLEPSGARESGLKGAAVSGLNGPSDPGAHHVTPVALVPPASSSPRDPETITAPDGVGVKASPVEPIVPVLSSDVVNAKDAPTAKPSFWEQFKAYVGGSRVPQKQDPVAPVSTVPQQPSPTIVFSPTAEAMAAPPEGRALSTISSSPGTPAPGAVIRVPPAPKP